ncbi:isoleucine--tRNA ligase [Patescibacteria group bacterium]|nr:isoleucine--tRNA ligase [Patescibacteria group bacterium]
MSKIKISTNFTPVEPKPDFAKNEKKILQWWYKKGIVRQYLNKNKQNTKTFSFIDGPITANNPMGVHHARGRTIKDVFQRYKNAKGFAQRFQNGFDCQGLWVEVEVEKEVGFNCKKDIVNYGLDKFTNACIARVNKFAKIQTEQSKRLAMFMDWDNSYYTMSENNNLYIWHFLKKVHQKGWLYKKKSAATWCPRCETGLSQHEQADGYKDITDTSVYLKFKLKNKTNEYVLAWTTTPWTLSANVLLTINTNFQYVKAKYGSDYFYLAKDSADRLKLTDYKIIDPNSLLNLEYESLYNIPAQKNIKHYIAQWDLVDPVEGTGVVHVAPGCGQEDFQLGQKLNSDMVAPLDETGHFMEGFGELTGKYAHHVANMVFDHLKKTGTFFKQESITHRYPHCWRCGTKCLFRLEDSWFIDCNQVRPMLKKNANDAKWIPKHISKRMQNWLDNMQDWMISRKRFYGLSLPFYECTCRHLTVIGSKDELKKLAVNPKLVDKLPSLHRPWIDQVEIICPKCQKNIKRITDVGDCWLDAGAVPFSTLKYLSDKKYWQKWFPADFICEMTEQIRLWYYSMLFFGTVLENKIPYLAVLNYSEVRDQKGERMSKTKGNGIPFDDAVEKMGADAMRWLYCKQKSHNVVNFGYDIANDVKKNFLLILWNTYRFFVNHADNQNWKPGSNFNPTHVLDKWILSRLNQTIKSTTQHLDKYNTAKATESIEDFIQDLSTWYVRQSRQRTECLDTLYFCLQQTLLLITPITPYISEENYQNLNQSHYKDKQSIHLGNWPQVDKDKIDLSLNRQMDLIREICQLIHAQRQKDAIKTRQPLESVTIKTIHQKLPDKLQQLIKLETNIKTIKWKITKSGTKIILNTKLTPALIQEGKYRDLTRQIQILRKENNLNLKDKIKIFSPNWPKSFEKQLLEKTLAVSIEKSDNLKIEKV